MNIIITIQEAKKAEKKNNYIFFSKEKMVLMMFHQNAYCRYSFHYQEKERSQIRTREAVTIDFLL